MKNSSPQLKNALVLISSSIGFSPKLIDFKCSQFRNVRSSITLKVCGNIMFSRPLSSKIPVDKKSPLLMCWNVHALKSAYFKSLQLQKTDLPIFSNDIGAVKDSSPENANAFS